jgi:hypothetical protein
MTFFNSKEKATPSNENRPTPGPDGRVAVDGFEQVFEMLKIADPAFRESLLKRLAARDRELARSLRERLAEL